MKLDPPSAAKYLDLAVATLATLRVRGGGPVYFKIGNKIRYAQEDLDAWLAARRRADTRTSSASSAGELPSNSLTADWGNGSPEFAVDQLDLVADSWRNALQKARAQRATGITPRLEQVGMLLEGIEGARELGRRAAVAIARGPAVDQLDLVVGLLWKAVQKAAAQHVTRIILNLDQVVMVLEGIEGARELSRRAAAPIARGKAV